MSNFCNFLKKKSDPNTCIHQTHLIAPLKKIFSFTCRFDPDMQIS